jgi:hypothetical protein
MEEKIVIRIKFILNDGTNIEVDFYNPFEEIVAAIRAKGGFITKDKVWVPLQSILYAKELL